MRIYIGCKTNVVYSCPVCKKRLTRERMNEKQINELLREAEKAENDDAAENTSHEHST